LKSLPAALFLKLWRAKDHDQLRGVLKDIGVPVAYDLQGIITVQKPNHKH
jgi:hypothetical protein